ncbi:hypothetical protein [Gordonia malaquae]|uniref:Uncharacterized protein n=1 Tax=Gordonia malaquae NBRC 108250 TaxID=1223542 RepID=M3V0L8_GORML|nr:hypothetical protein [Gordonia malaquae]GAC82032.1 hypothetical protein GM1_061_00020 [Gordonia malaquae NBRC 108250]
MTETNPLVEPESTAILELAQDWRETQVERDFSTTRSALAASLSKDPENRLELRSATPPATFANRLLERRFLQNGLWKQFENDPSPVASFSEVRRFEDGTTQLVGRRIVSRYLDDLASIDGVSHIAAVRKPLESPLFSEPETLNLLGDATTKLNHRILLSRSIKYRHPSDAIIFRFGSFDDPHHGFIVVTNTQQASSLAKAIGEYKQSADFS